MATANSINANQIGFQVYDGAGTWSGRTLQVGAGLNISNANGVGGNPTISSNGGGVTWSNVTSATQGMTANNAYIADRPAGVAFTLPATANIGDTFKLVSKLGLWTINYSTGQQVTIGTSSSTVTTGSVAASKLGDVITITCIVPNTVFICESGVGNFLIT